MLFNESSVRLYHDLSKEEILGIDATGSVVRKKNNFKKYFLYAITIRHPFGKTFPLPGVLYITGNHTIESVRYFIICLREFFKPQYFSSTMEKQLINIVIECSHLLLKNKRQRALKRRLYSYVLITCLLR